MWIDGEGGLEAGDAHRGLLERAPPCPRACAGRGRSRCMSIRPERTASISAWRSSSERSGGFILKRRSRQRTASSVSVRWCGVASQVICDARPPWRRRPPRPTRAPRGAGRGCARSRTRRARSRGRSSSTRRPTGRPAMPSSAATSPSCMTPLPESSGSSSWSAIWSAGERLVLERAAHHAGAPDRQAVVGEADGAGVGELGHVGELLAAHAAGDGGEEAGRARWRRSRRARAGTRSRPGCRPGGSVFAMPSIPQ